MSQYAVSIWNERGEENSDCCVAINFKIEIFGLEFRKLLGWDSLCDSVKKSDIYGFLRQNQIEKDGIRWNVIEI